MTDSLDAWAKRAELAVKGQTPRHAAPPRRKGRPMPTDAYAEAADVLDRFNRWRRDDRDAMPDPADAPNPAAIGLAIDLAVKVLRQRHGYRT